MCIRDRDLTYRAELAVVNLRVGRYEEALNVLKTALEKDPNYAEAYRLMGIAAVYKRQPLPPSFFELTTAMAFRYFADEKVDVAVIEVGLGGRLDLSLIPI